jgi:hypothetical protein
MGRSNDDNDWLWRRRVRLLAPLATPAPKRATMSAAMKETVEEIERRKAAAKTADGDYVAFLRARAERERLRQLEEDVRRFGSVAVETLLRRHDPNFTLPAELRGIEPATDKHDYGTYGKREWT